ncbi:hypothetical protein HK097_007099 [Rhizophlyctis rosea]|uniref:Transcription regulator Rua1 C-terminal domain-containing protein n=1 Tax=Rhizophlyctis rosea TaxID=64517 RepID=A0AAD5SDH9_9FUNG|nr:hypothetical protein HK097_007099 [Rhizophlyctis rosea]
MSPRHRRSASPSLQGMNPKTRVSLAPSPLQEAGVIGALGANAGDTSSSSRLIGGMVGSWQNGSPAYANDYQQMEGKLLRLSHDTFSKRDVHEGGDAGKEKGNQPTSATTNPPSTLHFNRGNQYLPYPYPQYQTTTTNPYMTMPPRAGMSTEFIYPPASIPPPDMSNVEYTNADPASPEGHFNSGPYSTAQGNNNDHNNNLEPPTQPGTGANSPAVSAGQSEQSQEGSWHENDAESPKVATTATAQDAAKQEAAGEETQAENPDNAKPRKQKLRFPGDSYTPGWVRYTGHQKEGFCEQCPKPGRWLQLKNSAYWYHKQFYHGISSVSGQFFTQPLDLRVVYISTPPSTPTGDSSANPPPPPVTNIMIEGLCHQCRTWVALMNAKRRGSIPNGSLAPPASGAAAKFSATAIPETDPATGATKALAQRTPSGSFALPNGQGTIPAPIAQEISDIMKSRGMTVLWFRHAHKCHVYHKPKPPHGPGHVPPPGHGVPTGGTPMMQTAGSADQSVGYGHFAHHGNASTPYGEMLHPMANHYGGSYNGGAGMYGIGAGSGSMVGRRASTTEYGGMAGMPNDYGGMAGYPAGSGSGSGMISSMGAMQHQQGPQLSYSQQQQQQQQHHLQQGSGSQGMQPPQGRYGSGPSYL